MRKTNQISNVLFQTRNSQMKFHLNQFNSISFSSIYLKFIYSPCSQAYPYHQSVGRTFSVTRRVLAQFWCTLLDPCVHCPLACDWIRLMSPLRYPETGRISKHKRGNGNQIMFYNSIKAKNDQKGTLATSDVRAVTVKHISHIHTYL